MELFFVDSKGKFRQHKKQGYFSSKRLTELLKNRRAIVLDKKRNNVTDFWANKLIKNKQTTSGLFKSSVTYVNKSRKIFNALGEELFLTHCPRTNLHWVVLEADGCLANEISFKSKSEAVDKFEELLECFY